MEEASDKMTEYTDEMSIAPVSTQENRQTGLPKNMVSDLR